MIRAAKASDTMRVISLMQEAHAKSRYADKGEVHREAAKMLLARAVHFYGRTHDGGTLYLVSETDGEVRGFFLAVIGRVYVVGTMLEAQDVHAYMSETADKRDYLRMLNAFDAWVDGNPMVIDATLSNSDFIEGAGDQLARIYEKRGYVRTNAVFKRRIEREPISEPTEECAA